MKKLCFKETEAINTEYSSGAKITELVNRYKRPRSTIYDSLRRSGVAIRPRGGERRKHFFDFCYFNKIDTAEKAYFLGLLYADGHITLDGRYCVLSLQEKDQDILKKMAVAVGFHDGLTFVKRPKPRQNMYRLVLASKALVSDLARAGCLNKKSLTLEFPSEEIVSKSLRSHFLRGYFDGDGCFCPHKKGVVFTLISTRQFCEAVQKYFWESLGLDVGSVTKHLSSKENVYVYYAASHKNVCGIMEHLYMDSSVSMDRKRTKYENYRKFFLEKSKMGLKDSIIHHEYSEHLKQHHD